MVYKLSDLTTSVSFHFCVKSCACIKNVNTNKYSIIFLFHLILVVKMVIRTPSNLRLNFASYKGGKTFLPSSWTLSLGSVN